MPLAVVVRTQITYRDGGSEEGVKLERLPASIDETTRVFRSRSPIQTSVLIVPAGFAHDKSGVVDFVNVGMECRTGTSAGATSNGLRDHAPTWPL